MLLPFKKHVCAFFTIKPSKYTSIVSSLLLKSLKPKVLLPCFLSDITCFFPVKRRVKGKKNYCKSRVSTFWVMVLYPLLMVGTNEDNVLTYQISLLGFILSKSKWREYIRENGVRERIGNEKDRKVNFARCILVLSRLLSGKLAMHNNENVNQLFSIWMWKPSCKLKKKAIATQCSKDYL